MKVKLRNKDIREDYVRNLLLERGIENVESFLSPSIAFLQSYRDLDNLDRVVPFLQTLCDKDSDEKALIVIDSDCDGYCSAAIIYQYIKTHNPKAKIDYINHEAKQHGLADIHTNCLLDDYSYVILPDAGTNDGEICALYPGTQFIVMDHHDMGEANFVPTNMHIVNNQMSPNYHNKGLCGTGVTWRVCHALDNVLGCNESDKYIDLVALATIADMMSVNSLENRYIISEGLKNINNQFFRALLEKQAYSLGSGPLTPIGLAFYVIPLINSMTRAGTLEEKNRMFQAFTTPDLLVSCNKRGAKGTMERVAIESARECTNTKSRQTKIQEKMTALADMQIFNNNLLDNKVLIVELDETFDGIPSEINGLSAMKLSQKYKRPTIVARTNSEGFLRGSARGLSTIDMPPLKEFFSGSGFFEYAEGHNLAHGISIQRNKVDKFLNWANNQLVDVDMGDNTWEVDFIRNGNDKDIEEIIFELDRLKATYGQRNPEAVININNINITKADIAIIGSKKDTVKITKNGIVYMFFKCTPEKIAKLTQHENSSLSVVGSMNINEFRGHCTPQIFVDDYEIENSDLMF